MTEGAQTAGTDLDAGEQARADIYRLLGALLVGPPDAALLELLRAIPQATDDAEETAMTTAWVGLQTAAVAAEPDRLKDEYFNLFIGLGRGELVPYASFYIHGLLMEKVLASLRTELAGLGIERQANVAEPEDHAAAICEVMGMIILEPGLHSRQAAFSGTNSHRGWGNILPNSRQQNTRISTRRWHNWDNSSWHWRTAIFPCQNNSGVTASSCVDT